MGNPTRFRFAPSAIRPPTLGGSYTNTSTAFRRSTRRGRSSQPGRVHTLDTEATHSIVADFTYELPLGRGRKLGTNWNRALDWIAGGWQVNGILSYLSGSP